MAVDRGGPRLRADLRRGPLSPHLLGASGASAQVALVGTRAMLLGGDDVALDVRVGAGCTLELVDTAGTVAYDGRGRPAAWTVDVVVEAGGALVWDALPFVVCDGADVTRTTRVRLGPGAVVCLRETVVLGRAGERGGRVVSGLSARDGGGPVLVERLAVDGAAPEPGVLAGARVLDQVVLLGRRPGEVAPAHVVPPGVVVLDLDEPGAVARVLGAETHTTCVAATAGAWADGVRGLARDGGQGGDVADVVAAGGGATAA